MLAKGLLGVFLLCEISGARSHGQELAIGELLPADTRDWFDAKAAGRRLADTGR